MENIEKALNEKFEQDMQVQLDKADKFAKIAEFNKLVYMFCTGNRLPQTVTAGTLKHLCESVIGGYVSAQEYVELWQNNFGYEFRIVPGRSETELTFYNSWSNVEFSIHMTSGEWDLFWEKCRNGRLVNYLK